MGYKLSQGLIQVYIGDGKGKSTAAFGLALRALGQGFKVLIVQFMKTGHGYGEVTALEKFKPNLEIYSFGRQGFIKKGQPLEEDYQLAADALSLARKKMISEEYDLIILDEINNALYFDLLSPEKVLEFMEEKPHRTELVLTGRNAPEEVLDQAHLVTEMKKIKHPYEKGIGSRAGIEY
ncbi:MAG TPA: cob(I)yrinic acid a,c-diamide adenosyltransferase [Clostridia bacterium]|jgi:cob(I)alamin adenosyltransferase|nr:cob(I)yrinic acid a,c-diamide adenosyltransferase [Clostridia bacterium]